MISKEIYLIRHGETDYNKQGIIQGSGVDIDLNTTGLKQAQAFYEAYRNSSFDLIIHSGLKRSYQTILPFIPDGVEVIEMPEFREISWGIYEGRPYHPELKQGYQDLINAWAAGDLNASLEGGESARELFERVEEGLHFIKNVKSERVLLCSHGRTIRAIMCMVRQQDASAMELVQHSNTGLYLINYVPPQMEVLISNDVSHLEEVLI